MKDKRKQVHKIELMVVDHDHLGKEGITNVIENIKYPNRCISPKVINIETKEVEWSDEHPLNMISGSKEYFRKMFSDKCGEDSNGTN